MTGVMRRILVDVGIYSCGTWSRGWLGIVESGIQSRGLHRGLEILGWETQRVLVGRLLS
jgi:hypothetical protein